MLMLLARILGPLLWKWIWESRDFAAVCSHMVDEMDANAEDARAGLTAFCEELVQRGILA